MAVIPQGVSHLVESVVSYLYIILMVLAIIKVVQLVRSIGGAVGAGRLFAGKKDKDNDDG